MSLINVATSNCMFALDHSTLSNDELWFVTFVLKEVKSMAETRKLSAGDRKACEMAPVRTATISAGKGQ